jgi:hypothetical protein
MRTLRFADGSTTTSYEHREMMSDSLGRPLRRDEHVHHKNENRSDNRVKKGHEFGGCPSSCCNLELLSHSAHAKLHADERPTEMVSLVCAGCGKKFARTASQYRHSTKQGKFGPFCGKGCAGRYTHQLYPGALAATRRIKDVKHGTKQMYWRGCRCSECRAANAAREATRRRELRT